MDYDVSISIGTQADLGGLRKAQQAVDGLAKAAGKVPGSLLSGGVGGASAPPVYTGTAFPSGGMSWQLEGASELTGSIKQVDKTIGNATQGMEKNSGWLARSINLMSSLPDKIKGWAGQQMQDWRKFDGGLQNLKNVGQLGREWWDYGWKAGQMLSNAFGVGVNKIQSHVATALDAAKAKMAAWQTSLSETLSRQKEEKWLKKEEAGVKQINAAYEARKKVIEDLDRKAQARLELENKLLQIETEKNRSIIRQRQIRGDISDSQARDELAKLDAKDAEDRRRIEQQQAEQALKTAQQLAEAKEEQVRRLQEFQRMPNKGNVENLSKEGLFGQVDNLKAADAALKDWQRIAQRKAELEKEISKADGKMAKTAMVPAASPFLIAALRQKKTQDEESLKSVLAEQQAMAGQYGMQGQDFGQVAAMLTKRSQDARTALDKSMALIKGTGLLGDLSGKSGDAVYLEYARVLSVVKDLANNQGEYIETTLKESVSGGIERILQTITKLQGKPVKDRTKEETKDLEQLRKWRRWCARYCLTRATVAREFHDGNQESSPGCCSSWKPFLPVTAPRSWKRPCP